MRCVESGLLNMLADGQLASVCVRLSGKGRQVLYQHGEAGEWKVEAREGKEGLPYLLSFNRQATIEVPTMTSDTAYGCGTSHLPLSFAFVNHLSPDSAHPLQLRVNVLPSRIDHITHNDILTFALHF